MTGSRAVLDDLMDLRGIPLLDGLDEADLMAIVGCRMARTASFGKDETVLRAGSVTRSLGIVLEGRVCIASVDFWGNAGVLDVAGPRQIFAEVYALLRGEPLLVTVTATEPTRVLLLNVLEVIHAEQFRGEASSALMSNLLEIVARKNLHMSQRMLHTSPKQVRRRIVSYLSSVAVRKRSSEFDIPFNRQQLADYLSVDRSALSSELSSMAREGLLETRRSHFRLFKI